MKQIILYILGVFILCISNVNAYIYKHPVSTNGGEGKVAIFFIAFGIIFYILKECTGIKFFETLGRLFFGGGIIFGLSVVINLIY